MLAEDMNRPLNITAIKSLILVFFCFLSASCWPMRFVTSPGAKGVVVDSRDHRPLQNVEVFVSRVGFDPPETKNPFTGRLEPVYGPYDTFQPPSLEKALTSVRSPTVITGPDGHFFIPREARWGIYIVPMELFPVAGSLLLRQNGKVEITKHLVSNSSEIDVGQVVWHKK